MYVRGNCCWVPMTLVFCHSFAQCKGIRIQESGIHVSLKKKIGNTVPGIWTIPHSLSVLSYLAEFLKTCLKTDQNIHHEYIRTL